MTIVLALITLLAAGEVRAETYTVTNSSSDFYFFNNSLLNPDLHLVRGQTYTFNVSAPGHPFWIKTARIGGTGSAYNSGVTGNGTAVGTVTFTIPIEAPSRLFYVCQAHSNMSGIFHITTPLATPGLGPPLAAAAGLLLAAWGALRMNRRRPESQDS